LVLAGAAVADLDELPDDVRAVIESAEQVFVVTPTLPTGIQWLMSDTDRARHEADEAWTRSSDSSSQAARASWEARSATTPP
jgi:hypothetical protein